MRIKISPHDSCCQYIVDKEKGKVVCVIHSTKYMLENFISDFDPMLLELTDWKNIRMPNQFSGVASCAEDDEWDEAVGREIAFARAKYKLDKSFFKRANSFVNNIDKRINRLFDEFNSYGEVLSKNHSKRVKSLESKLGEDFVLYRND